MFLTRDMDDRVIIDIMNDVILPQGRYPENFMMIYKLESCGRYELKRRCDKGRWNFFCLLYLRLYPTKGGGSMM